MNYISVYGQSDDYMIVTIYTDTEKFTDQVDDTELEFSVGNIGFKYEFGEKGWQFLSWIIDEERRADGIIDIKINNDKCPYSPNLIVNFDSEVKLVCKKLLGKEIKIKEIMQTYNDDIDRLFDKLNENGYLNLFE